MADSRGLDTYYLNPRYREHYGIDKVFAEQLDRFLQGCGGAVRREAVLLPGHFREGTVRNRILRLALTDPAAVVLCDGIWETLLNREKHFARAEALGRLPSGLFGSDRPADRDRAGEVLTALFLDGALDVSPAGYGRALDEIVGYFARRRRRVYWLSLPVPPGDHRGGVHYAGDYRPLPGWDRCLAAINATAGRVLADWGQQLVDLDPMVAAAGGADAALLDLWHFTAAFHRDVAAHLADRLIHDLTDACPARHPSHDAMIAGRAGGWPTAVLGRDISAEAATGLTEAFLVVPDRDRALSLLGSCDESVVLLYPDELPDDGRP